jgi:hypothetical protein
LEREQVPEKKDIEAIEKMLLDLGETELELGEINEQEYRIQHGMQTGEPDITDVEEAELILPEETVQPAETTTADTVASGDEDDFQELLKDIEIGLTEEREFQEKLAAGEELPPAKEIEPVEEVAFTEADLPDEGQPESEKPLEAAEGEAAAIEAIPGLEELLGEEAAATQPDTLPEQFEDLVTSDEPGGDVPQTGSTEEPEPPESVIPEEQPAMEVEEEAAGPEVPEDAVFPEELFEDALGPPEETGETPVPEEPAFPEQMFETPPESEITEEAAGEVSESVTPEELVPDEVLESITPEEPAPEEVLESITLEEPEPPESVIPEEQPAMEVEEEAAGPEAPEDAVFPEELFEDALGPTEETGEIPVPEEPAFDEALESIAPEEPASMEIEEEAAGPEDLEVQLEEETLPGESAVEPAAEPAAEQGAEPAPEAIDESSLDLPDDFDLGDISAEERPPFAGDEGKHEAAEGGEAGTEAEGEVTAEAGEAAAVETPREHAISIDEPTVELEDLLFQEPKEEGGLAEGEAEERLAPQTPEPGDELSFPDLESLGVQEEALSEGLTLPEGIDEESAAAVLPGFDSDQEAERGVPEVEEITAEEAAVSEGEVIELTEDDIGQIKAKLSTMSPVVAAVVQDIIVKSSLPAEAMNRVVELLILDAPEQEIIAVVERETGRKITVPPTRRPVPVAARKPGFIGALAENIGPFVRASMLIGAILVVAAALFFVFFWNPYNASRHYRQALLSVEKNDWAQVEESLDIVSSYQSRSPQFFHGIRQYDNLGWNLMLAGQYSMAERVLERGVLKELDKNQSMQNIKGVRNSSIFMRLAILYNILGRHGDSEEIYAFVLNDLGGLKSSHYQTAETVGQYQQPYIIRLFDDTDFIQRQKRSLREYRAVDSDQDRLRKMDEVTLRVAERIGEATSLSKTDEYDFRMLRGENLMDTLWDNGIDAGSIEEQRDDIALVQYQRAAEIKRGEAAPYYKQLQVFIRRNDAAAVSRVTDMIGRRFPKARDEEVQTELATFLIANENFSRVRQLLLDALNKRGMVYPFPPAYVTFGNYHRAVGNRALQEEYLLAAVEAEFDRVLPSQWNFQDRKLVSWTDFDKQRTVARSIAEETPGEQLTGTDFLFPWDERNNGLLSVAYNGLGEIYARGESFENVAKAIRYFRRAIDPDAGPQSEKATFNAEVPEATFSLAQLYYYRVKDYQNALKLYKAYETAYKESRFRNVNGSPYPPYVNDLYYNLGYLYYNEMQNNGRQVLDQALAYWSKLESLLPDNPHVQMAIGNTLLHKGAYESALGRFIYLAEVYDRLVEGLGEIKPWQDYDRRILGEAAAVYNNLGVAYQMLSEQRQIDNYQRNSLVALYKAGEYADLLGEDRGNIQYNIYYIIHPDVVRSDMKINDDLSDTYRFSVQ